MPIKDLDELTTENRCLMAAVWSSAFLRTQSDDRLVALAAGGQQGAFEALVARHHRSLVAVAQRIVGADAAPDVTQQALLRAWQAIDRGETEVRHARGWLHRVLRSTAIDHLRASRGPTVTLDDAAPSPENLADTLELRTDARQALSLIAALPDEQRTAVVATAQGQTQAEIARLMGLTEGAVRQMMYRTRAGLRAAMTAITPYPLAVSLAQRLTTESAATVGAVAGGSSAAGVAIIGKVGVALIATGAVAGGVVVAQPEHGGLDRRAGGAPAAASAKGIHSFTRTTNGIPVALSPAVTTFTVTGARSSSPLRLIATGFEGPGAGADADEVGQPSVSDVDPGGSAGERQDRSQDPGGPRRPLRDDGVRPRDGGSVAEVPPGPGSLANRPPAPSGQVVVRPSMQEREERRHDSSSTADAGRRSGSAPGAEGPGERERSQGSPRPQRSGPSRPRPTRSPAPPRTDPGPGSGRSGARPPTAQGPTPAGAAPSQPARLAQSQPGAPAGPVVETGVADGRP